MDALKAEQKAINDSLKKQRADGLEITDAMKDEKKLVDAAVKEARELYQGDVDADRRGQLLERQPPVPARQGECGRRGHAHHGARLAGCWRAV